MIFVVHSMNKFNFRSSFLMSGDEIKNDIEGFKLYKMKTSKTNHLEDDPLLDCKTYSENDNYNSCIESELHSRFIELMGCVPHWFTDNPLHICTGSLNTSSLNTEAIYKYLNKIITNYRPKTCKTPCTVMNYESKYRSYNPIKGDVLSSGINIIFDDTVEISQSNLVVDTKTLLLRLGSVVGVCRTLLWILVAVAGLFHSLRELV